MNGRAGNGEALAAPGRVRYATRHTRTHVPTSEAASPRLRLRVLVVAAHEFAERLSSILHDLRTFEPSVESAGSIEAGLAALSGKPHDICFVDGDLDDRLELARRARASGSEIPIVLLTRSADFSHEMEALRSGVTHFIETDYLRPSVVDRILRNILLRDRLSHQHRADQRALAESEQRLRTIVEWAGILTYEWDLETDTVQWDGSHGGPARFTTADLPRTLGATLELIHPDDRRRFEAAIERHLESEDEGFNQEYRIRHPDGSYRIWLDRGKVARGRGGQAVRWLGMVSDVTEARQLAERMRVAQRLEALGRLAGGVAHDFNNIITVISGYVDTALDALPPGSPIAEDLRQVHHAAERAANLTHQLLAFSRKQLLEPAVLDVNDVVRAVEGMLRRTLGEDVDLSFEPGEALRAVRADPWQLEQALVNLAVNARDAMPDGGSLVVRTLNFDADAEFVRRDDRMAPGRYVRLQVEDTGTGIAPDVLKHIFDPFFTTKERGHGTGLGLATVYGIVKQSGGHVWVDTELGVGTTFSIDLPAVEGPARPLPRAVDSAATHAAPDGANRTILVVEDDDSIRVMVTDLLERAGFRVIAAASGSEAIDVAARHAGAIDLLLTDVILPGRNGLEAAREILRSRPGIAVLYTSGYTEDVLGSTLAAGTNLLRKPFSPAALVRTVAEILGQDAQLIRDGQGRDASRP